MYCNCAYGIIDLELRSSPSVMHFVSDKHTGNRDDKCLHRVVQGHSRGSCNEPCKAPGKRPERVTLGKKCIRPTAADKAIRKLKVIADNVVGPR